MVRAHDDPQVVHPEGRVDPLADIETIETELLFADLEQAERRLERVSKQAKSLDKAAVAEERWLRDVVDALREGRAARTVPPPADAPEALRAASRPLTAKPVLYVANVAEGEPLEPPPELVGARRGVAAPGGGGERAASRPSCRSWTTRRPRRCATDLGAGESGLDDA